MLINLRQNSTGMKQDFTKMTEGWNQMQFVTVRTLAASAAGGGLP
jgi:hypothetical protein